MCRKRAGKVGSGIGRIRGMWMGRLVTVLAVAEACDVAGRGVSVNHVGVFADLGRAVDSALGIDGETWAGSGRALRALAGAS